MTKVLFVTPTTSNNAFDESIGTLLLTSILLKAGIQTAIFPFYRFGDISNFSHFIETATDIICNEDPKIVSFYTRCDCYHIMLRIAEEIKKRIDCYIVFAGPQADITAKETIEEIPFVDFVCCGEGETTVYPFFSSLLKGEPNTTVRGLVYRSEGQVIVNPRPELIHDLDSTPIVDYSIFPPGTLFDNTAPFAIDVGRGCPFGCTYCSTNNFWGRKYRLKSPQRIVEEIKCFYNQFGIGRFAFAHDMFTMNRKQVVETCRLIKELDFNITWTCSARIDCIDEELVDIMVESGLKRIFIGIESGSPRIQKLINKNLKLENVLKTLTYIHSKNIDIIASFIYGFPEETEEDISKTLALIIDIAKLRKVTTQVHLCTFLPGTALSQKYKDSLTPAVNYSDITGAAGVTECAELIRKHPNLFWHFSEYKTELRSKLEGFNIFVRVFRALWPAYQIFFEKYDGEDILKAYFDFAEDNNDIVFSETQLNDQDKARLIVKNDKFAKRFSDSEYADIIDDVYRLEIAKLSVQTGEVDTATEITCVSPIDLERCTHLSECKRTICMVTYSKNEDGSLQTRIRRT